ncbi:MAG: ATP-dependent Clp protease proteolytic subunit [Bacteroidales bacterium]|nr:ATP-dependent Clp protease proteolytic subunit [Bacteroidales bacterium]
MRNVQVKKDQIFIYGVIGFDDEFLDKTNNTDYHLVQTIKSVADRYNRINIHINSPGGSIVEGLAVYNTIQSLRQEGKEIHTYNDGLVASMASIIFFSGITHMPKTALMMLHRASTIAIGNANDFQEMIGMLEKFEETLVAAIDDRIEMGAEAIKEKYFNGEDHYLTGEEAAEMGFVDHTETYKAKTPASPNNIMNSDFRTILNIYEEKKTLSWDTVKDMFNFGKSTNTDNKNSNTMEKFKSAAMLIALFAIDAFNLNENGKAELSPDELMTIDNSLQEKDAEIERLKNETQEKDQQIENLKQEKEALENKAPGKVNDGEEKDDDPPKWTQANHIQEAKKYI